MNFNGMRVAAAFLVWMLLCLVLGCAAGRFGGPAANEQQGAFRFVLAPEGLPEDGAWKSTPLFADFNGDGFLDLAATSRLGDGAHVWLGDGSGRWRDSSEGLKMEKSCGGGVAAGDVNNDGNLDLAVADHCSGAYVYLGDGEGHWQAAARELYLSLPDNDPSVVVGFFKGAEDLDLGDVNEDGFLDLVVAASDLGGFTVFFGDGTGTSWQEAEPGDGLPSYRDQEPGDEEEGGWANQIVLSDINKDGHLDVIASYYYGPSVWLGDGKGNWWPSSEGLDRPLIYGMYRGLTVGDVNEDGLLDLAVASWVNGPEVFLQQADGSWKRTQDVIPAMKGGAHAVALADLNLDGHLDLLVGGRLKKQVGNFYGIHVCRGNGKGEWSLLENTGLLSTGLPITWGIGLGDVNRDGLLDFAVGTGGQPGLTRIKPDVGHASTDKKTVIPRLQVWLHQ